MIQHTIHRFRYWFLSAVVLISVFLTFTGTGIFSTWEKSAYTQGPNYAKEAYDHADPSGGCLSIYPVGGAYPPTTNSCAGE